MLDQIIQAGIVVLVPVIRSVAGWAVHALEDKKVTKLEWRLLAGTVVRVGSIGIMTYIGLNELGVDVSALGATAAAYVLDKMFGSMKDNNNVTKR